MTLVRSAIYEGDRELRRAATRFGEDFREMRLQAGVSQAAVARAIGVARSVICRMEAGNVEVAAYIRSRAAAALGAQFRFGLYADGPALIRDAAQAAIVERLLAMRHRRWSATVEAPVPGPGQRSTDVRLEAHEDLVLTEVETHIGPSTASSASATTSAQPWPPMPGKRVHATAPSAVGLQVGRSAAEASALVQARPRADASRRGFRGERTASRQTSLLKSRPGTTSRTPSSCPAGGRLIRQSTPP